MIRPALIHACLGSLTLAATLASCQSPEAFRPHEDAGAPGAGTGGDGMGGMGAMGGAISASGGTIGSGGLVGSGGDVGTGGAGGEGRGGTPAGGRGGGATGGAGGSGGGGATAGSAGTGGTGGSGGTGSGGTAGGSAGGPGPGSGGTSLGGRGGDTGGRGGASAGSGGATGGRGGAGGGVAGAGGTTSKILSIDFGVGGQGAPAMTSSEVAGVKAVSRWNSAAGAQGSLNTLTLADGSAVSGATVSWMAPSAASPSTGLYSVGVSTSTGDGHMLNGYLDPSMSPAYTATIMVSSLPAPFTNGGYDVYVYYMAQLNSGVTRKHKLSIGSKTFTVSQTGPSPTTFSKHTQTADNGTTGDYVVFTNVTGASFTLTSAAVSASDNNMRAPVNGIQIVWPSGS